MCFVTAWWRKLPKWREQKQAEQKPGAVVQARGGGGSDGKVAGKWKGRGGQR